MSLPKQGVMGPSGSMTVGKRDGDAAPVSAAARSPRASHPTHTPQSVEPREPLRCDPQGSPINVPHPTPAQIEAWVCPICGYWRKDKSTGVHMHFPNAGKGQRHPLTKAAYVYVGEAD